jgi:iron(III) transport system ATP-binding protein
VAGIEIESLSKRYGSLAAVEGLSLDVADGEFVTLLGPSGCGKTTTLRLLAGFVGPDAGSIRVGGQTVSSPAGCVPPEARGMGMVFQN